MNHAGDALPLAELQAFAAVAEARSFRAAATRLGVTPSAVSHSLRTLEARLGLRLLHRTTRSVAPTEAGARLLATLAPALADIRRAVGEAREAADTPRGTLRLTAPRTAAHLVLMPRLARFLAAHPGMAVELSCDEALVDIVAAGFDPATVDKVLRLVRIGEWKRHQAAPGPKVSRRAFGRERRYPISNGYREG